MTSIDRVAIHRLGLALLCALTATWVSPAFAQFAPTKPMRLIIASPPGGGTDAIGRMLAETLSLVIGQQVVPENKAGASGVIASEELLRAAPDGMTLMVVQNGHTMNPAIFKRLPYDTLTDFTPVSTLARSPLVLVASSKVPVTSISDLIALGKRDPKALNFGAAEASTRLAIHLLSQAIGLPVAVVGYKGTGPTMVDVAAGHMNFTVTTIASTLPYRTGDRIRYLGVMASERTNLLPGVASVREQGLVNLETTGWWGVVGPRSMSPALATEINGLIQKAMTAAGVADRLRGLAAELWLGSPANFDEHIRREVSQTLDIAAKAGIVAE